jgi:hypothetical protein
MSRAAHAVLPRDRAVVVEQEAPVRVFARSRPLGMVGFGQGQGGAVVDRRQSAREQDLALEIEFLLRFIAAIDASRRDQAFERGFIDCEAGRLAFLGIVIEPEPGEIGVDRLDMLFPAALGIGVVDAQRNAACRLAKASCGARCGYLPT